MACNGTYRLRQCKLSAASKNAERALGWDQFSGLQIRGPSPEEQLFQILFRMCFLACDFRSHSRPIQTCPLTNEHSQTLENSPREINPKRQTLKKLQAKFNVSSSRPELTMKFHSKKDFFQDILRIWPHWATLRNPVHFVLLLDCPFFSTPHYKHLQISSPH